MSIYIIHNNAIIHRDIKPHNVFLNKDRTQAKLGDFGVSTEKKKSNNTFTGSPYYMSPDILNSSYN